jgi:hypothetical protein
MILCCREDHNTDSPRFVASQNKVHFDLQNYGLLWWDPTDLDRFSEELRLKIEKRKKALTRETAALREAPEFWRSVSKDIATKLDEKLRLLTEREERLAATWKKRS